MEAKFRDANGRAVEDFKKEILDFVKKDHTYQLFIGSDSQLHRGEDCVVYATVVVIYKQSKGGRFFVRKKKGAILKSLRERLARETWESVELAIQMKEFLPGNVDLQVHVDSNSSKRYKSGNYTEELVGMITSQGFKCRIKPDAWAAQTIANRFTK